MASNREATTMVAASPPSPPPGISTTGRPPKWSRSAQRKMARLYLYTTLPLDAIVRLVHRAAAAAPDAVPGLDSANKRLNVLLDKEPRWLHPRNEADMGRRIAQLSSSPVRLAAAAADDAAPDPSSPPPSHDAAVKPEQPSDAAVPAPGPDPFLRRTSCLSTSTDRSADSFRDLLPGYSAAYLQTVKTLVRRFTVPTINPSPTPHDLMPPRSWLEDPDAPRPFDAEPFPLPGHLLSLDIFAQQQLCPALPETHRQGRCLCFNECDTYVVAPWLTPYDLTPVARRILHSGLAPMDLLARDSSGNTALHFLAARAPLDLLLDALRTDMCNPLLNATNTGGQTFLHVMNRDQMQHVHLLHLLLRLLSTKPLDVYALDVYGRNFFHMLRLGGLGPDTMLPILQPYDMTKYNSRDAFGVRPAAQNVTCGNPPEPVHPDPPVPDTDSAIAKEARLVEHVRLARDNPLLEDAAGCNGLHCLAMATLSPGSVYRKHRLATTVQEQSGKKQQKPDMLPGSCGARLEFRHSLAVGLLEAGVDPNQYDLGGSTPLMAFVAELPEHGDYKTGPQMLDLLIKHGANVHARNRAGETALHIAVRCGRKLAAKTLVKNGASVHARDAEGRGVLDVADVKLVGSSCDDPREYAHYEACRAWLSSSKGLAVQRPTVLDEWRLRP